VASLFKYIDLPSLRRHYPDQVQRVEGDDCPPLSQKFMAPRLDFLEAVYSTDWSWSRNSSIQDTFHKSEQNVHHDVKSEVCGVWQRLYRYQTALLLLIWKLLPTKLEYTLAPTPGINIYIFLMAMLHHRYLRGFSYDCS
jgi:hypothetical protein